MDDGLTLFVEIFPGDPHWLELLHLGKDRATEPRRVLTIGGRLYRRAHRRSCQRLDFLGHACVDALKHSATAGQHDVSEQVFADVLVTLHNRVVSMFVDAVLTQVRHQSGREKKLRAPETLLSHKNVLATGQLVHSFVFDGLVRLLHLCVKIKSDLTVQNFDHFTLLKVSGRLSDLLRVLLAQHRVHEFCQVFTADWDLSRSERNRVPLIDRHCVGYTLTTVHYRAGGLTLGEE